MSFVVYRDTELKGGNWGAVDGVTYLSLILRFDMSIMDGYLNRIQIYSLKKGIKINFQVWREVRSAASGSAFFLISESPHITKTQGGFENTVGSLTSRTHCPLLVEFELSSHALRLP